MKLEEWKKFLDLIPDNDYTRKLGYTQFKEAKTVDGEDEDAMDCYVLLNEKLITVRYANADRGFAIVIKGYETDEITADENGDLITECVFGNVKIIKYQCKERYEDFPEQM